MSKDCEPTKADVATLKTKLDKISTSMEEMKAMIKELTAAVLNPWRKAVARKLVPQIFMYHHPRRVNKSLVKFLHHKPQPECEKTLDCLMLLGGSKLEVGDFHGNNNPEVFLDWLHNLESFFRWYRLTDEQEFFFLNAKGAASVWWAKFQQTHYATIISWEDMKIAMTRYFVPDNYKQRVHLQFTQLVQGSMSIEE